MDSKITLISKSNVCGIPHKNNRKNKNRSFYLWKLERFKEKAESDIEVDVFPSSPENSRIQKIKEKVIFEINNRNIFDFEFTAIEKDYLSIRSKKEANDYLNLIYLNGKWTEEFFVYTERSFFDVYTKIEDGEFELI